MIVFILIFCLAVVKGSDIHPDVHHPQPYSFGYTIKDKEIMQHRQETGNGAGVVHGNYGFIDNKGLQRQVDYVADHGGFRAAVHTNEPGTSGQSPAAIHMKSTNPYTHGTAAAYAFAFQKLYGHKAYEHGDHQYVMPAPDRHMYLTPIRSQKPLHLPEHALAHPLLLQQPETLHVPIHGHIAHFPASTHLYNPVHFYGPRHNHVFDTAHIMEIPQNYHLRFHGSRGY